MRPTSALALASLLLAGCELAGSYTVALRPSAPASVAMRSSSLLACASDDTAASQTSPAAWRGAAATLAFCAASMVGGAASARCGGTTTDAGILHERAPLSRLLGSSPAWAADAATAEAPMRTLSAPQRKRLKLAFKAKLAKVPVFMVTNDGGSPFLNQLSSGDQSALMFLFPAEAQRMLAGVLKAPNGGSSGAKVLATNMDRAFKLARLDPMASGLRDQVTQRELTMVWQFMPHAAERQRAQLLLAKTGKITAPSVPAYMVEGLVITKRGKEVRPVFLAKKDCDAAVAALGGKEGGGAEGGTAGKVIVYDALGMMLQLVQQIEAGDSDVAEELDTLEFVPPSESVEFREQLKRDKPKLKAKIVPPSHHY